jgi:hypothetical protein
VAGTGLDEAVGAGVDGARVGAGDVTEAAALVGAVTGAGLDGVAAVVGRGAGDVVSGRGEDGDGLPDGLAGGDPDAGWPGDDAGDVGGGTV